MTMMQPIRLTADLVVRWAMEAQPGATLCYAAGYSCAGAGEEVLKQLRYEEANGFVHFKQRRAGPGEGFLYLAERSSRPLVMAPGSALGRRGVKP